RPGLPSRHRGGQRQSASATCNLGVGVRASRDERRGGGTDRGWRLLSGRGVGDSPAPLRPSVARYRQRSRCAPRQRARARIVVGFHRSLVRRRRARGPAPARRRAAHRTCASASHSRAARVVATGLGRSRRRARRMTLRIWAGGAIIGVALLVFGLLRPNDGSVPFFLLLALAAVGYL